MKLGILTFHSAKNYGAVLQAYALKVTIENLGHQAYIIDRRRVSKTLKHKLIKLFYPSSIKNRTLWRNFDNFSKKYLLPKTKLYGTTESVLKFHEENLDAVIVGSDQVWRLEFSSIGLNYYLDFIDSSKTKKISYAASFGLEEWTEKTDITNTVKLLLEDFSAISVRENSGLSICNNFFGIDAKLVLDPTLLLDRNDYEYLLTNYVEKIDRQNEMVSYMLGVENNVISFLNEFSQSLTLNYQDLYKLSSEAEKAEFGYVQKKHLEVEQWLRRIKNAEYVVTNSYHATIFSIIFEKKFIVVNHKNGGSDRIMTLLGNVGLENRYVNDVKQISHEVLDKDIDYSNVKDKLLILREDSLDFLRNNI